MTHLAALLTERVLEARRECAANEALRTKARQHFLDALAAVMVGLRVGTHQTLLACLEPKENGMRVPGSRSGFSALDAASLVAYLVNSSVYEDGSRTGACHPAAITLATLWAEGGERPLNELLPAMTAGYEAMVNLAAMGNPGFTQRGFHPTGIVAPFGAAAVAGLLLGLSPEQLEQALVLAASGGCGLMRTFREGSTQPLHIAHATRAGIVAALMAEQGAKGDPAILEMGLLPAYLGAEPAEGLAQKAAPWQGREWALNLAYLKPYPGCRHIHPAIDALEGVLAQTSLAKDAIKTMTVDTYRVAVDTEIEPVRSRGDAYFNIPYALAARLILGGAGYDAFGEPHLKDPGIAELAERVKVRVDPEIEGLYPAKRGAKLTVELASGEALSHFILDPKGEPENPVTYAETEQKFAREARGLLSDEGIEAVLALVREGDAPAGQAYRILTKASL